MKHDYLNHLSGVASQIRAMRENLPEVNDSDLAILSQKLAELDISGAEEGEVARLKEAFALLGDEIQMTMQRLDQYCDELRGNLDDLQQHSTGVKAYAVAHNSK